MEQHEEMLGMEFFIPGLPEKKRNNRRKATEIKRMYTCPVADCNKSYGYESTLKHHLKIKHQGVEPTQKVERKTGPNDDVHIEMRQVDDGFQVPMKLAKRQTISRAATGESETEQRLAGE